MTWNDDEFDGLTDDEVTWKLMGPFHGGVPGLVRRVRRILDVSQRGLAALLGTSQSRVARWETGRTSPTMAVVEDLLARAGIALQFHDGDGEVVEPMRDDGSRDRGNRRFPAHVDLSAYEWWTPRGSSSMAWHPLAVRRARQRQDPRITFRLSPWRKAAERLMWGTPVDHPARHQLVAEVRWIDEQREDRDRPRRERLERLRQRWCEQLDADHSA